MNKLDEEYNLKKFSDNQNKSLNSFISSKEVSEAVIEIDDNSYYSKLCNNNDELKDQFIIDTLHYKSDNNYKGVVESSDEEYVPTNEKRIHNKRMKNSNKVVGENVEEVQVEKKKRGRKPLKRNIDGDLQYDSPNSKNISIKSIKPKPLIGQLKLIPQPIALSNSSSSNYFTKMGINPSQVYQISLPNVQNTYKPILTKGRQRGRPRKHDRTSFQYFKQSNNLMEMEFRSPPSITNHIPQYRKRGRKRKFPSSNLNTENSNTLILTNIKSDKISPDKIINSIPVSTEVFDRYNKQSNAPLEYNLNHSTPQIKCVSSNSYSYRETYEDVSLEELDPDFMEDIYRASNVRSNEIANVDVEDDTDEEIDYNEENHELCEERMEIIRKAEHNLVERRRRDRINSYICELHKVLPQIQRNKVGKSKGAILKAVYDHYKTQCDSFNMLKDKCRILVEKCHQKDKLIHQLEQDKSSLAKKLNFINQSVSATLLKASGCSISNDINTPSKINSKLNSLVSLTDYTETSSKPDQFTIKPFRPEYFDC